jgi:ribosomal protein L32
MVDNDTYEAIAADYAVSRQRIAAIVAQVEGWIADHPRHKLAQKMRVECGRRWDAIWSRAIESFDHSRQYRRTSKERAVRRRSGLAGDQTPVVTVTEQRHGVASLVHRVSV